MVRPTWSAEKGWHDAVLEPYAPLPFEPATNFLHCGQAIFEGLQAYRHADGSIRTFRPLKNAARCSASARRLATTRPSRARNWWRCDDMPHCRSSHLSGHLEASMDSNEQWREERAAALVGEVAARASGWFVGDGEPHTREGWVFATSEWFLFLSRAPLRPHAGVAATSLDPYTVLVPVRHRMIVFTLPPVLGDGEVDFGEGVVFSIARLDVEDLAEAMGVPL
jgi:hypothetical protein